MKTGWKLRAPFISVPFGDLGAFRVFASNDRTVLIRQRHEYAYGGREYDTGFSGGSEVSFLTPKTQRRKENVLGTSVPLPPGHQSPEPGNVMTKRRVIKRLVILCGVLLIAGVVAFGFQALRRSTAEEYRTFASPDGRFQIVVYRIPMSSALPGQDSDAPGFFQLRDARQVESCVSAQWRWSSLLTR
jgi:hypothetical protein